ncbi:MAG: YggS family pyridoxal phosphate-dependent enzyme [Microbacteriaceae bacterium]|nr:MAG: YggS family pyridoxal phosphate-dependent enzyme [Microbacteriaceae bacterium]
MSGVQTAGELASRLEAVRGRIAAAARDAGRATSELTTIVVTKFHPASLVRELAALGVRDVGENRHQEAQEKARACADLDLTWHFVGQLQSKKAKQARQYARVIHSVDRPALVSALESATASVDCFVQYNLTTDPARGGVDSAGLERLVEQILGTSGLRLIGVMAVAPLGEEPRAAFARLRGISDRVRSLAPDAESISAGMSEDFEAAIAEGATHLRIGTAITGKRPSRD